MMFIFCCSSSSDKDTPSNLTQNNLVLPLSKIQSKTKSTINSTKELLIYKKGSDISSINLNELFDAKSSIEILKVLTSSNHSLLFLKDNKYGTFLCGSGSNQNGQLGLPVKLNEPYHYPSLKRIDNEAIKNKTIIDIAIGDSFSLILIEDPLTHLKQLIKFALTKEESFTLINNPNSSIIPVKEELFKHNISNIIKVYSDEQRTILLSKDNKVFIKGNLFNLDINTSYKLFKEFEASPSIKDIAFGNNHCLFLFNDNTLFALGHNEFGELGLKSNNSEDFNKHTAFSNNLIRKIVCGKRHSLVLCENGELYSFGDNSEYQCTGNEKCVLSPTLIEFKPMVSINDVYCGGNYSIAKSTKGELYCWGNCDFLFPKEFGGIERIFEPKAITSLKLRNIQGVYPGKDQVLFYNETLNK